MTRVIVFNARRGSEIADLTLDEFDTATSDFDPAVSATLTQVEKQLLARLKVIQVVGKRNRPVPVLLTEDMHNSVAVAVLKEMHLGSEVCEENKYLFALPASKTSRLHFYGVLQRVAVDAKLKKPRNLTTTRLRKHLATVVQVYFYSLYTVDVCYSKIRL